MAFIMPVAVPSSSSRRMLSPKALGMQEFLNEARGFAGVHLFVASHWGRFTARHPVNSYSYRLLAERPGLAELIFEDEKGVSRLPVNQVAYASFKQDTVLGLPLYTVQFLDARKLIAFSFTLKADAKTNEYEPEQLRTYNSMLEAYGPDAIISD